MVYIVRSGFIGKKSELYFLRQVLRSLLLEEKVPSLPRRMRCSRRRRRYFKDILLILSSTDAPHPTPHHLLRRSFSSRRSLLQILHSASFEVNVTSASFVQREVARDSVTEGLFLLKSFASLPLCVTVARKAFLASATLAFSCERK